MKKYFWVVIFFLLSCSQKPNNLATVEAKVAALEQTITELKPGLGEIMGVIQQHHAKLYYSGISENWDLARYQLGEIREGLDDALKYYPKFKEVKTPITELIPAIIKPSLDSVGSAIDHKNKREFVRAFNSLSDSCTNCHRAAEHPFIKIQTPTEGMFSNQKFTPLLVR